MNGGGFLCVPREVWAWPNPEHARAFMDLQFRASWAPQEKRTQGRAVTVEAGELLFSLREASAWWRWSVKTVRAFMDNLDAQGLIEYPEGTEFRTMYRVRLTPYWGTTDVAAGTSRGTRKGTSRGTTKYDADSELGGLGIQAGAQGRAQAGEQGIGDEEGDKTSSPSEKRDKNAGTRTRKGTRRCPDDWQPDESCITLAAALGMDDHCQQVQEARMRDHTFATPRSDWDATFRNWLREAAERGQARGNGNGKHATAPEHDAGEVQRAHQAQAEQAQEEFDRQREAWRVEVVSAWDRAPPLEKQRIRMLAEQGFEELRGNDVRFERAVRWRCLELLGDEIGIPKPTRKHA